MKAYRFAVPIEVEVIIERNSLGFHAYCPALKGLHTCGDTEAEALQNAKDAARAYVKSSLKHGDVVSLDSWLLKEGAKFKVGDMVEVKPDAPGYQLWYKGQEGIITALTTNDQGELRYKVGFVNGLLPFGEWEIASLGKVKA